MVVAACALALIPQGAQAQRQNPAQTTSTVITYTVKPGDNDWDLAERFGTTSKEIRRLNPGVNWNSLRPGMKLRIPSRRAAPSAPRATQRTASAPSNAPRVRVTGDDVIVRSGPGRQHGRVTTVAKNREGRALETRPGWMKVQFSGGVTGWISTDFVTRVGSAPAATRTASAASRPAATPAPRTQPARTEATAGTNDMIRVARTDVILRAEPNRESARVAKLNQGQTARVLYRSNGWVKVRFASGTTGWLRADMVEDMGRPTLARRTPSATPPVTTPADESGPEIVAVTPAPANTAAPAATTAAPAPAKPAPRANPAPANRPRAVSTPKAAKIIDTAEDQLGVRYRWGGTSRSGFDCSGFVQWVFARHGIRLPRTSASQATVGTAVRRSDLKVGDLVFFRTTRSGRISHVGIYIGNNRFIHASSGRSMRVRTNSLGESYYNSRYAGARRLPGLTKKVTDDIESLPVSPEGDEPPVQTGS